MSSNYVIMYQLWMVSDFGEHNISISLWHLMNMLHSMIFAVTHITYDSCTLTWPGVLELGSFQALCSSSFAWLGISWIDLWEMWQAHLCGWWAGTLPYQHCEIHTAPSPQPCKSGMKLANIGHTTRSYSIYNVNMNEKMVILSTGRRPLNWVDKSKMATWLIPGTQSLMFLDCLIRNGNDKYSFSISCVRHLQIYQNHDKCLTFFWGGMTSALFGNDNKIISGTASHWIEGSSR